MPRLKMTQAGYRLCAGLAIPLMFFFSSYTYFYPCVGFLLVLASPSRLRRPVLAWSSLVTAFLYPHFATYSTYPAVNKKDGELLASAFHDTMSPWLLPYFTGAAAMAFMFLIFLFARRLQDFSESAKDWLRLGLPIFAVAVFPAAMALSAYPRIYALVLVFAFSFGFYVWFIALSLGRGTPDFLYRSKKNFWVLSLFFWRDSIPYWHIESLDAIHAPPEERDCPRYDELFRKIVELTLVAALFWLGDRVLFGRLDLPSPWDIGTAAFMRLTPNVFTAWVTVIFLSVHFLVSAYVRMSMAALTLFLFGVTPVYNMNQPWKSKSLHEFVGRTIYFYNLTLTSVYWPVALRWMRRLPIGNRPKLFIFVFFSAIYFSFFYHLIRGHRMLLSGDFSAGLWAYVLSIFPYIFFFSLTLAISVAWKEIWRWGDRSYVLRAVKVGIFTVIYSLILSLDFNYQFEPSSVRLRMVRYLFTGIR